MLPSGVGMEELPLSMVALDALLPELDRRSWTELTDLVFIQ